MRPRQQSPVVLHQITSIKVLADVTADVLLNQEYASWVRSLVAADIKYQVAENGKLFPCGKPAYKLLEAHILLKLYLGVGLHILDVFHRRHGLHSGGSDGFQWLNVIPLLSELRPEWLDRSEFEAVQQFKHRQGRTEDRDVHERQVGQFCGSIVAALCRINPIVGYKPAENH